MSVKRKSPSPRIPKLSGTLAKRPARPVPVAEPTAEPAHLPVAPQASHTNGGVAKPKLGGA